MKWIDFKKQLQSIGVTEITDGALYMALPSFENVRWLVPLKDKHSFRSALQLYIPNTLKGKLYKFSMEHLPLPLLRRCSAKIVRLDYKNGRFFAPHNEACQPAFYVGNEGSDSKATIQMLKNGVPFSYIKFTENPQIAVLFEREAATLNKVSGIQSAVLPQVLQCSHENGVYFFETSSVCDHRTQPSFELCSQHKEFLLELADYTFVENGAAEWAAQMENNLGSLGSALSWMKTMFLNTATPEFLANVKFDLNHGDFSPWNCVVENGKLAVFDWEYASAPKPAFLDAVHFILKPILLKKTAEVGSLIGEIKKISDYLREVGCAAMSSEALLTIYLLDQYILYTLRSEKKTTQEQEQLDLWKKYLMLLSQSGKGV